MNVAMRASTKRLGVSARRLASTMTKCQVARVLRDRSRPKATLYSSSLGAAPSVTLTIGQDVVSMCVLGVGMREIIRLWLELRPRTGDSRLADCTYGRGP